MLYATIFHLLAGMITGSIFKVRILLLVLGFVLVEFVILAFVHGNAAGLWAAASLLVVEMGYVAGIFGRRIFEQASYSSQSGRRRNLRKP